MRPLTLRSVLCLVLFGLAPATTLAQDVPERSEAPTPDIVVPVSRPDPPTPGGAFLRSLAVPGWGHAAIGAYGRGAFYVAAEAGTAYALVRTRVRLSDARQREALRERVLRQAWEGEGITDPTVIEDRLDADSALTDARGLVSARESQQEDLVALGIFLMLLSGADAFVSAHLAQFPDPIDVGVTPGPGGRLELSVGIPWRGP